MKTMYSVAKSKASNIKFLYNKIEKDTDIIDSVKDKTEQETAKLIEERISRELQHLAPADRIEYLRKEIEKAKEEQITWDGETNERARSKLLEFFGRIETICNDLSERCKKHGYPEYRGEKEREKKVQNEMKKIKEILNTSLGDFSKVSKDISWMYEDFENSIQYILNTIGPNSLSFYFVEEVLVKRLKSVATALLKQEKDKEIDE